MQEKEKLDYCRVKKIFDKGYGFLTSLYHKENVFFHFSGIKDHNVKEKLENLQRGDLYFFYTSYEVEGKRKVKKLWLSLSDVEKDLLPEFENKITEEFISGETNPFEVAYVIKQLRVNEYLSDENFYKILSSQKIRKTPSLLKATLIEDEAVHSDKIESLIDQLESNQIKFDDWFEKIATILNLPH